MTSDRPRFLSLQGISFRTTLGALLLGLGVAAPLMIIAGLLPAAPRADLPELFNQPWRWFLASVLMGPFIEELIFRGLILQLLRRYTPNWFAALLSAALFAGLHAMRGWGNVVNAFIMGLVFAWMVIRSQSLLPTLICHPTINFTALFLLTPLTNIKERVLSGEDTSQVLRAEGGAISMLPVWVSAISLVVTIAGFKLLSKEFAKQGSSSDQVK